MEKMRVCLSVLGAAKTESGYNTRCKSFCFVMIGTYAKWAALTAGKQFPTLEPSEI